MLHHPICYDGDDDDDGYSVDDDDGDCDGVDGIGMIWWCSDIAVLSFCISSIM